MSSRQAPQHGIDLSLRRPAICRTVLPQRVKTSRLTALSGRCLRVLTGAVAGNTPCGKEHRGRDKTTTSTTHEKNCLIQTAVDSIRAWGTAIQRAWSIADDTCGWQNQLMNQALRATAVKTTTPKKPANKSPAKRRVIAAEAADGPASVSQGADTENQAAQAFTRSQAVAEALSAVREAENRKGKTVLLQPGEKRARRQALYAAVKAQEMTIAQADLERATKRALTGRPTKYSPIIASMACAWVSEGRSLRSFCEQHGVTLQTMWTWIAVQPEFAERYKIAQVSRADSMVDEMIDISDAGGDITMEEVQLRKLKIETRKWLAGKMNARQWGEQKEQAAQTGFTINIGIPAAPLITVEEAGSGTAVQLSR